MASEFKIPLHRFDTNLLPPDARQVGTESFKTAVMLHFAVEYAAQGQTALVTARLDGGPGRWHLMNEGGDRSRQIAVGLVG